LVWFGLDDFLKTNRTKPNRMHFYLAVRMTFILKTEPNRTAITPNESYSGEYNNDNDGKADIATKQQ
jgi:hypothetical protein